MCQKWLLALIISISPVFFRGVSMSPVTLFLITARRWKVFMTIWVIIPLLPKPTLGFHVVDQNSSIMHRLKCSLSWIVYRRVESPAFSLRDTPPLNVCFPHFADRKCYRFPVLDSVSAYSRSYYAYINADRRPTNLQKEVHHETASFHCGRSIIRKTTTCGFGSGYRAWLRNILQLDSVCSPGGIWTRKIMFFCLEYHRSLAVVLILTP